MKNLPVHSIERKWWRGTDYLDMRNYPDEGGSEKCNCIRWIQWILRAVCTLDCVWGHVACFELLRRRWRRGVDSEIMSEAAVEEVSVLSSIYCGKGEFRLIQQSGKSVTCPPSQRTQHTLQHDDRVVPLLKRLRHVRAHTADRTNIIRNPDFLLLPCYY